MSKAYFDATVLDKNCLKSGHKKFNNSSLGFEDFLEWVQGLIQEGNPLFCMEHTGIYSRGLWFFLQDRGFALWVESGFQIYRGIGIAKGKNDKIDSFRIAEYALTRQFKAKVTPYYDKRMFLLHDLLTARNSLINNLKRMEVPLNEIKKYGGKTNYEAVNEVYSQAIKGLKGSIKKAEDIINQLIKETPEWKENLELATSVTGVGKIVALWILVYTRNFSDDFNARKFASLAGIAPFTSVSGTSVKRGTHVHKFSNKFLKGILHNTAMTAITWNPTMKEYHRKKKKEGKKGFLVMNNVKNKIVQQIFAVVRSKQKFNPNFLHPKAA